MELSSEQIDARIQKNRTCEATIAVAGAEGKPLANADVTVCQTRHKFLFGCNIFKFGRCATPEQNETYQRRFKELLNFATLPFYWRSYEPKEGDTASAQRNEEIARWCKENGVTAKGHPLFWTLEPPWVSQTKTPDEAEALLWGRISREVKQFDGLIDTWDALNEGCIGPKQATSRSAGAALHVYEKYGRQSAIERAFARAREANPNAMLILNDYNLTKQYEDLIRDCLKSGVTIDAIGLQSHMHGGYWGAEKTWDACERFAKFKKPLHFTEVTIPSGKGKQLAPEKWEWTIAPGDEETQARHIAEFYRVLFSHPATQAITWWDFSDQGAWRNAPAGLLRKDMSPKPAYLVLQKLVKGEWWTGPLQLKTDAEGKARFRGFLGDYEIEAGGRRQTFRLLSNAKTPIPLKFPKVP